MELRFLRWALLVLLLAIVTTEAGRGTTTKAPKDEEKSTTVRSRSSPRFTPRVTVAKTTSESPLNADSTTSKTSRRASGFRKTTVSRFNKSHSGTTTVPSVDKSTPKTQTETAISQTPEKSKPTPRKFLFHQPARGVSRNKLIPKLRMPETEKIANNSTAKDNEEGSEDRKYLPDELNDDARSAQDDEDTEGIESPKVPDFTRVGGRLSGKLTDDRVKPESDIGAPESQRARTGRKIQIPIRPVRPLKIGPTPITKVTKEKSSEDSEMESTVEVMATERSLEHEPLDFRKKLSESHLKQDSSADGSENVRVNIPINAEDSKKPVVPATDNSGSQPIEVPKRLTPYKPRGRLSTTTKKPEKLESENATLGNEVPSIRPSLRRGAISRGTPTEVANVNRVRNRHPERKTTTPSDSSTSTTSATSAPSTRRRTYIPKSPHRVSAHEGSSKNTDNNNVSEKKIHHVESRKTTRPRGRYRTETSTTSTTELAPSSTSTSTTTTTTTTTTTSTTTTTTPAPSTTLAVSSTPFLPTVSYASPVDVTPITVGKITPLYEADLPVTTFQPAIRWSSTLATTKSADVLADSVESVEIERRSGEVETQLDENIGEKRRASKDDFFNHGLGFRGRKPIASVVDEAPTVVITSSTTAPVLQPESSAKGNPGWTLKRRPGHWQDGLQPVPAGDTVTASNPVEQAKAATTSSSVVKTVRRGNKTYTKVPGGAVRDEEDENDNYPPEFKARLAQMKTGVPFQPKPPSEEPRLHTSSNVIDTTSADLELASSDNAYQVVVETTFPNYPTLSLLSNPSPLDEQQVRNIKKED